MFRFFIVAFMLISALSSARAQTIENLRGMSIDQLANLDVSSVTKTAEALSDAPAAIYVITHDQIMRSGAQTLPDILRLAPNLQVYQVSASSFIVTARGFSGNINDQAFANKLLVLIDGRSVYTPLYSGVYWDMQDVLPADIERIEVISGPGATLWGANAVNGVINIITRKAKDTQGGLIDISAGNLEQSVGLRYGGTLSDDLAYRFYVRDYFGDDTETASGANAHDHWSRPQGGVRFDWTPSGADSVTLEGDDFAGSEAQPGAPYEDIAGRNLTAHWTHDFADGSSLQFLTYYDREERATEDNGGNFWVDTYDFEAQHNFTPNDWNTINWGGGFRVSDYNIHGNAGLQFVPTSRGLDLSDIFAQDSIAIDPSLTAIFGFKIEDDPFSGVTPLPSGRLSWKVGGQALVWAAVSRAVRSPTPFDEDVVEKAGSSVLLTGNPYFVDETLTAYEIGTRIEPAERLSFSISAYYNDYDDLRSIELTPVTFFPLTWGNKLQGDTYGFESWGNYQLYEWWRLSASFTELREHFDFQPGSTGVAVGVSQIGDDPQKTATFRSAMDLTPDVNFDWDLRYVSKLPNPVVPAYVEMNASVGWNVSKTLRLSLSGFNLLHARHQEFPASEADAVPRSFSVGLQWRF
ncbi:MAG TPA: TonB-dependent receptor [Rhizomicrobium sp.]|nr:TonB-dependent receptor [Rhizomicrobium sp.]